MDRICPTCFIALPASGVCDEHGIAIVKTALPATKSVMAPERPVSVAAPKREAAGDFLAVAREYLAGLGLGHVEVTWDQGRRRLGACYFLFGAPIKISFSRAMFAHMSEQEKWNTLTHEAAHALVGRKPGDFDGHTEEWRRKHIELGGDGKRCSDIEVDDKAYKWVGTCPAGHTTKRHAKSARMFKGSCGKCSPVYNPAYSLTWVQNF